MSFGTIDLKLMFRRLWTLTIAAWALVGLPTLCTAGVLTHPCEPEESHQPVQHTHDENEGGCHHESDCAQDPCEIAVTRPSDGYDAAAAPFSVAVPITIPIILLDPHVFTPHFLSSPPGFVFRASSLDALTTTILLI